MSVVLSAVPLAAIVFAQFRLLSRSMSSLVGGTEFVGPMLISDIAAVVMIVISVNLAVFMTDGWGRVGLFTVIASLPSGLRRRFVIVNSALLIAMAMAQAGTVYVAGLVAQDAVARGAEPAAPVTLIFSLGFNADDPTLAAIGCLLPILMIGSVVVLTRQFAARLGSEVGTTEVREGTVTRL